MRIKRILILYTSKGLGHKIIAENIAWHLQQAGYQVKLGDLLKIQEGKLVKYFSIAHSFVNAHMGWLWKFFYVNKTFINITLPWRLKAAARLSDRAREFINEFDPDAVLVTQGSFAGVVAHLKAIGAYAKPLIVGFSDYHLHRYWLYDEVDHYLANIPEQKEEMIRLGIPASKISVCGITLRPLTYIDVPETRSKMGLLSRDHLVILAAGSMGIGLTAKKIERLSHSLQIQAHKRGVNIILAVICGQNEKLRHRLNELKLTNVRVYGYFTPFSELYQVADVFLTKPGGLSIAEALAYRVPILLTHMLPGQEELNLNYLVRQGLVIGYESIDRPEKVAWHVLEEIQKGRFRKYLAKNPLIQELSPVDGKAVISAVDSQIAKD